VKAAARRRRSLSSQIALGVALGAAIGLFFGEGVSFLQVVADAYVRLLQMTVLPYVTVAIIIGLGSLDAKQARALGTRVGVILVLMWTVAIAMVVLFPLMFPQNQNASFFSAALVEERETFDFLGLYIPTNPFNSLANNVVPSVVLFSVVVGAALIANPHKRRLLDVLDVAANAISKATNFIVQLTPYGVFAIAAVVAGTLRIEELQRLQVYLITYVAMSLLISLWVLPGLVATLTPVPYRALMSRTRDALVLAFMTTSLFAVLPLIIEETKALLREYANVGVEQDAATDVIVPATFNFPHTGKLLSLSFILFAGWFADRAVPVSEYPRLAGTGLLVLFGNVNAAIPYLLDLFRIPADTFRLFVASGIVNARFGTLVAAVHTLAIAVLGTCAVTGTLRVDARKIVRFAIVTGILLVLVVGGSRFVLQVALHRPYDKDTILTGMRMTRDRGPARVYRSGEEVAPLPVTSSVLDRVRQRGILRVGYFDDSLPFAFFNSRGELVGLDVEMGLQLARDLGVRAELVPIDRAALGSGLDPASCDLVMSGAVIMADRAATVRYSAPYLFETVAFIVPDHLTAAFSDWSSIRAMGRLRLGVPRAPYFMRKIRDELGDVDVVPIDRMNDMFAPHDPPLDAGVATAERGSAYTLLHPDYSVVVPKPRPLKVPLAYIIAGRDAAMVAMVNTWIELKRADGTIDELFSYWILGQDNALRTPRWSVIHDVLHWR
jgi:Na+/H+-dicarboxylate symporter/ABC-type amino acid transport substrate-binding protein